VQRGLARLENAGLLTVRRIGRQKHYQRDTAASDIDVLIVSDELTYGELFQALESASRALGRRINPTAWGLRPGACFRSAMISETAPSTKVPLRLLSGWSRT
jgi:hypothetical protein